MPTRHLYSSAVLLALVALATGSNAIVIRHDQPDDAYRALAAEVPFCSLALGGWGGGCALIDPHWVITAAHAAGRLEAGAQIEVGGESVEIAEVIVHPEFDEQRYRNDLALLRLAEPVRDQERVGLHAGRDEVGRRAVFVGRGHSGTGETGITVRDKELRGAENEIEKATDHWLIFVFDAPPEGLELEGISGPGDSGGPAFLETEGGWTLVGISSWQDNSAQGAEGVYGVREFYVRISSYVGWIEETVGRPVQVTEASSRSR